MALRANFTTGASLAEAVATFPRSMGWKKQTKKRAKPKVGFALCAFLLVAFELTATNHYARAVAGKDGGADDIPSVRDGETYEG